MQPKIAHSFSSIEQFEKCPKQFYHLRVAKDYKEKEGEESIAGKRDHKAFEERLKSGVPLPEHLTKHENKCANITSSGMVIKPEQELAITKELMPCDWWHQDVYLRVKADVALYGKTKAALMDWKTGKKRPKPFQLELGALLQFIHYPSLKLVKAAFLWLQDDVSSGYTYTRDDDYDRILNKLNTKTRKIEESVIEDVWQAKPGWHCKYCPVKDDCSYSQA